MKFKNARKGPYVAPHVIPREDGELIFEHDVIQPGAVGKLDPKSESVRMHLLAGYLQPADAEAHQLLDELRNPHPASKRSKKDD